MLKEASMRDILLYLQVLRPKASSTYRALFSKKTAVSPIISKIILIPYILPKSKIQMSNKNKGKHGLLRDGKHPSLPIKTRITSFSNIIQKKMFGEKNLNQPTILMNKDSGKRLTQMSLLRQLKGIIQLRIPRE